MRLRSAGLSLLFILITLFAPLGADAQQAGKVYRIGILSELSRTDAWEDYWRDALRRRGYI